MAHKSIAKIFLKYNLSDVYTIQILEVIIYSKVIEE